MGIKHPFLKNLLSSRKQIICCNRVGKWNWKWSSIS